MKVKCYGTAVFFGLWQSLKFGVSWRRQCVLGGDFFPQPRSKIIEMFLVKT